MRGRSLFVGRKRGAARTRAPGILTPTLVPGLDLTELYFLHNRGLSLILEALEGALEVDAVIVTASTDFLGVVDRRRSSSGPCYIAAHV